MINTGKTGPDFKRTKLCPHCGHQMDTGQLSPMEAEVANAIPEPGDLGVCIACAGFLVYVDNEGTARAMMPKDLEELDAETKTRLIDMRLTIKAMWCNG